MGKFKNFPTVNLFSLIHSFNYRIIDNGLVARRFTKLYYSISLRFSKYSLFIHIEIFSFTTIYYCCRSVDSVARCCAAQRCDIEFRLQ